MKILVHDYSGHPFQSELSRELSRRGHEVVHSYCDAYYSGKGRLEATEGETLRFEVIAEGVSMDKQRFLVRLVQELRFGVLLSRQVLRVRPAVALVGNTPLPTLAVMTLVLWLWRIPWVHWQQDVQAVAIRSFAGTRLSRHFKLVAASMAVVERWCCRRSQHVVAISEAFLDVHRRWGTLAKTTVIHNWAPVAEICPADRHNSWSASHGLDDTLTLLYSGTLGLKHNPKLLVRLARRVLDSGVPVHLVVVSEGPSMAVIEAEAARLGVPVTLLPFQPYEALSEVLSSGDVLLVVLEKDAGAFSVPSKTMSYLCAGRPVLALIPEQNIAADLVRRAGGFVGSPQERSLGPAADWVRGVLKDDACRAELGSRSRALAESEFVLSRNADRFEELLTAASRA